MSGRSGLILLGILVMHLGCMDDGASNSRSAFRWGDRHLGSAPRGPHVSVPPPSLGAPTYAWSRLYPSGDPPTAYGGGAGFDAANDRLIWFGGSQGSYTLPSNAAWSLSFGDVLGWSLMPSLENSPEPRIFPLVIDMPGTDDLLVFGGERFQKEPGDQFMLNDLWVMKAASLVPTWQQLISNNSANPPMGRVWTAGTFNANANALVVFGGGTMGGPGLMSGDTWAAADGTDGWTWQRISSPPDGPGPVASACFAYHPLLDGLVVAGGVGPAGMVRDVWFLPLVEGAFSPWIRVAVTDDRPLPYASCECAFDPVAKLVLCYGGEEMHAGEKYSRDATSLWGLVLTSQSTGFWRQAIGVGVPPTGHLGSTIVLDRRRDRFVRVFGAYYDSENGLHATNETWILERVPTN